mmetsp:Transcript_121077/g.376990  ORF Transcript_121077/g.376990 Transcript_121077/m.376990 type:complete len:210 (+) Transcript_121077:180-809(+)
MTTISREMTEVLKATWTAVPGSPLVFALIGDERHVCMPWAATLVTRAPPRKWICTLLRDCSTSSMYLNECVDQRMPSSREWTASWTTAACDWLSASSSLAAASAPGAASASACMLPPGLAAGGSAAPGCILHLRVRIWELGSVASTSVKPSPSVCLRRAAGSALSSRRCAGASRRRRSRAEVRGCRRLSVSPWRLRLLCTWTKALTSTR